MFTNNGLSNEEIELLKVSRVRYYYHKTPVVSNTFTVCLLIGGDGKILSRGVSICSLLDTHNKKKARNISCGRAVAALQGMKSDKEIHFDERFLDLHISRSLKIEDGSLDYFMGYMSPYVSKFTHRYDNGKGRITYYLPYNHNLIETKKFFKFKSEYLPDPTVLEEELFLKSRKVEGDK